jgi:hypothetical protein
LAAVFVLAVYGRVRPAGGGGVSGFLEGSRPETWKIRNGGGLVGLCLVARRVPSLTLTNQHVWVGPLKSGGRVRRTWDGAGEGELARWRRGRRRARRGDAGSAERGGAMPAPRRGGGRRRAATREGEGEMRSGGGGKMRSGGGGKTRSGGGGGG